MKYTVIANWKMYIEKPEAAKRYITTFKRTSRSLKNLDITLVPPFTLIPTLRAALGQSTVHLGAQAISPFSEAKHTGDVSAAMLKSFGVTHVIVGHSERRAAGESLDAVRAQIERAQAAGLTVVLCIGEVERDPQGAYLTAVAEELTTALRGNKSSKLIVAYEPVWAIGKSAQEAMKPQELQEMVIFIRKTLADVVGRAPALKVPILYGGSVEIENAKTLLQEGGVAGFLVGHASTDAEKFITLLKTLA